MLKETTARDVAERFCVSTRAEDILARWQRQRPLVAQHVLGHVTRTPYATSRAALGEVAGSTEHALGAVRKADVQGVDAIRDWTTSFATTHVLHHALESLAEPFTYQQFREFCRQDAGARVMLWDPAQLMVDGIAARIGAQRARDAMRWRIGNSYYSFMRELVTVVALRQRGLDLAVHPLADALFRVDAWIDQTVVALYIGNAAFRDGTTGRKPDPASLLGPSFRYVSINLPAQHEFGRLHVPSEVALDQAAAQIRKALDG